LRPIWTQVDNLFTKDECNQIIEVSKERLVSAETNKDGEPSKKTWGRRSQICWIDSQSCLNALVARAARLLTDISLAEHCLNIDFIENPQFTQYKPFDYYRKHKDVGFGGPHRLMSATVELTNPKDYVGGGVWIDSLGGTKPRLNQGSMVAFPSILNHSALPVWFGTRYSMVIWAHFIGEKKPSDTATRGNAEG
jgi:predicted 2-oxoglutarate/Fe(II)-dependent dioxygenase YbiX